MVHITEQPLCSTESIVSPKHIANAPIETMETTWQHITHHKPVCNRPLPDAYLLVEVMCFPVRKRKLISRGATGGHSDTQAMASTRDGHVAKGHTLGATH